MPRGGAAAYDAVWVGIFSQSSCWRLSPLSSGWGGARIPPMSFDSKETEKQGAASQGRAPGFARAPTALKLRRITIPCSGRDSRWVLCNSRSAETKSHPRGRQRRRSSQFHPRRRAIAVFALACAMALDGRRLWRMDALQRGNAPLASRNATWQMVQYLQSIDSTGVLQVST